MMSTKVWAKEFLNNVHLTYFCNTYESVLQEEFFATILYEYFDSNHGHHNKLRAFEVGFLQLTDQKGVSRELQRYLISFISKNLLDCIAPEACIQGKTKSNKDFHFSCFYLSN